MEILNVCSVTELTCTTTEFRLARLYSGEEQSFQPHVGWKSKAPVSQLVDKLD